MKTCWKDRATEVSSWTLASRSSTESVSLTSSARTGSGKAATVCAAGYRSGDKSLRLAKRKVNSEE